MSSADESQSSGSSASVGNYKINIVEDNEEEIEEAANEEVDQPGPGVLLSYIDPDSGLEASEIEKRLKDNLKKLLEDKKLILVLDLEDLINSALLDDLTPSERLLLNVEDRPDYLIHKLNEENYVLTKLRPFIHKFLKKANSMFEMYLSTRRKQDFLEDFLALLDPGKGYFPSRIIRPDKTRRIKNVLDAQLGVENVTIILDDDEKVWEDHKENLIVLEMYNFFAFTVKELGPGVKSWSDRGQDESTSGGTLKSILDVLKRIHECFYEPKTKVDLAQRDVRVILGTLRKRILAGCNIVFSGVFDSNVRPEEQHIWKLAEGMGAICSTDMSDSMTHIVVAGPNSLCESWTRQKNRFLVTTHWIMAAHYLWRRRDEENYFPVKI